MGLSSPTYQIGSWIAGDTGTADQFGTLFRVNPQGTTGIFDGVAARLNQTPFPNYDGAQRSNSFDATLPITLAGSAIGLTPASTLASQRAFVALFVGGTQQTLTMTHLDGLVLSALVEKNDIPRAILANPLEMDWQLSLIATNPRKFAAASTASTGLPVTTGALLWGTGLHWGTGLDWGSSASNGLIQLTNPGTGEAWPVFTLTGPPSGSLVNPIIVNSGTGETLAFAGTLNPGDTLVISTSPFNRFVRLNGVPYRRFLTTAEWFSIQPGQTITVQFQGNSTSTAQLLAASLAPAYQ